LEDGPGNRGPVLKKKVTGRVKSSLGLIQRVEKTLFMEGFRGSNAEFGRGKSQKGYNRRYNRIFRSEKQKKNNGRKERYALAQIIIWGKGLEGRTRESWPRGKTEIWTIRG